VVWSSENSLKCLRSRFRGFRWFCAACRPGQGRDLARDSECLEIFDFLQGISVLRDLYHFGHSKSVLSLWMISNSRSGWTSPLFHSWNCPLMPTQGISATKSSNWELSNPSKSPKDSSCHNLSNQRISIWPPSKLFVSNQKELCWGLIGFSRRKAGLTRKVWVIWYRCKRCRLVWPRRGRLLLTSSLCRYDNWNKSSALSWTWTRF